MFHWTEEGTNLKNGFNVYRFDDPASTGFKFKFGPWGYIWRYSWRRRRVFKGWVYAAPVDWDKLS